MSHCHNTNNCSWLLVDFLHRDRVAVYIELLVLMGLAPYGAPPEVFEDPNAIRGNWPAESLLFAAWSLALIGNVTRCPLWAERRQRVGTGPRFWTRKQRSRRNMPQRIDKFREPNSGPHPIILANP